MLSTLYLCSLLIASLHCYPQNNRCNEVKGNEECADRIHRQCPELTEFTDEEVENARIYIQRRFIATNPVKPACKRLRVKKNIKCLTNRELSELIDVFQQMYKNGVMDKFSLIHGTYWPSVHKFDEAITWHRWHIIQMEKEMRKINPRITMPYWETYSEFAAPEKSSIWDFLGHAGKRDNNYCVADGPFAHQRVRFPKPHCLKREWTNGTIPRYESPECMTSVIQRSTTYSQWSNSFGFAGHFKLHLAFGGFNGDMSIQFSPNDPLFYVLHEHHVNVLTLVWQLSEDEYLVPQSYSNGSRFDWRTKQILPADIENDFLTFYDDIRVKETFQMGFGELCFIPDYLIKPINELMRNRKPHFPIVVNRLSFSLPPKLYNFYFPKFASNSATFFDHLLPDVGNCPIDNNCSDMPFAPTYNSTPNGRRQLERLRVDASADLTPDVFEAEDMYYRFMYDLRNYHYCSPYV